MSSEIILTTGDLKQDYHVIGPVYYQISNRGGGLFTSSLFEQLVTKYTAQLNPYFSQEKARFLHLTLCFARASDWPKSYICSH